MNKYEMYAKRRVSENVPFYTFPLLEKAGVLHGFSTKLGGVSTGDCASMNLSFHRGDNSESVMENHKRFAKAVGYDYRNLVFSDQVHTTNIRVVKAEDKGKGIIRESDIKETDGLITQDKDVVLMTFFADCVPLFFYDPVKETVGLSHSGWRGTVMKMGQCTVEAMKREFQTKPEDLYVVIGPSICQSCYEVSEDVAEEFKKSFRPEHYESILMEKEIPAEKGHKKYQLDLWQANKIILEDAGILTEHIQISGMCTCCHKDELFSHRATNGRRGNLAAVITLAGHKTEEV